MGQQDYRKITGAILSVAAIAVAGFCAYAAMQKAELPKMDSRATALTSIPRPFLYAGFFGHRPVGRVQYVNEVVAAATRFAGTDEAIDRKDIEVLTQKTPRSRFIRILQEYLEYDPDKNGTLTKYETADLAGKAFDTLDADHDGQLAGQERLVLASLAKSAAFRAACTAKAPAPDEKLVVVSGEEGRLISTVSLAGQDRTTTAASIVIAPGKEKIYLVAAQDRPMIWLVSGDVKRVTNMAVAGTVNDESGRIEAGVVGLPAGKVSFHDRQTCLPAVGTPLTSLDKEGAARDLIWFFHRNADVLDGRIRMFGMKLDGNTLSFIPDEKQTEVPAGFDPQTWQAFITNYDGVIDLTKAPVVSDETAEPYEILPGYAGLAQLVARGMVVSSPPVGYTPGGNIDAAAVAALEYLAQRFWIVRDLPALPADVYANFILAKGIKLPEKTESACVVSQETGRALTGGASCDILGYPVEPGGPEGECVYKNDPQFKEVLRQKYLQYSAAGSLGATGYETEFSGTNNDDTIFMKGKNAVAQIKGLAGRDFYFIPLKKGQYTVTEQPAAETNTLVFADMPKSESPDLVFKRPDSTSLQIKLKTQGKPFIKISNWFGGGAGQVKPVSCFVFLPEFDILSANEIDAWGRRQVLALPLREFKPGLNKTAPARQILQDLPPGTVVHYLGMDESAEGLKPPPGVKGDSYGRVDVRVWPTKAPVYLMLGSFNPAHWVIRADKNAQIAGILLTGHGRQSIESNLPGIPVKNVSAENVPENHYLGAHKNMMGSKDKTIETLTGMPRARIHFQYQHQGTVFEVR
jgi:hypothetical protein